MYFGHLNLVMKEKLICLICVLVRYFEQGETWHGASELVHEYQIQREVKLKNFMDGLPQLAYLLLDTLLSNLYGLI